MYLRTEGVILKKRNFGEADRLLTIYTRDYGKLTVLARGVRRPRSKKAGHLELGNWCKFFIAKGKNIDLISEVETKKAFGIADFNEEHTNKIYHLLELINALTAENQKNPQVFNLLVEFLKKTREADFNLIASAFKVKLLTILGFFSHQSFSDIKTQKIFSILEREDLEGIEKKINSTPSGYLKLLSFLDSMIEDITSSKLKTTRFLDGQI